MVKEQKIKNAVFLSGGGSVRNDHVHSVSNRMFPSKNVFTEDPTAPIDMVSINDHVSNGRVYAPDADDRREGVCDFDDSLDFSRPDDQSYR